MAPEKWTSFQKQCESSILIVKECESGMLLYDNLLLNNVGCSKKKRKLHKGGIPKSPEVDNAVFEFLVNERDEGRCISNEMLMKKASEHAAQQQIQGFKASTGWLRRWKKQYHVGIRRGINESQKATEDYCTLNICSRKENHLHCIFGVWFPIWSLFPLAPLLLHSHLTYT